MAGTQSSSSLLYIGNCEVEIEGNNITCDSARSDLRISVADAATIKISVNNSRRYNTRNSCKNIILNSQPGIQNGGKDRLLDDHSFTLLNPKDADGPSKQLMQDVLKIYTKELPTMNYAANTGKQSQFLERCVSSGKYCTLVLKSNATRGSGEVIAAVSYQIIPADTQYAEIPVAAVCSKHQHKGIGRLLYTELRKRLQHVGVLTLFCWGDKESEGFWVKQGFVIMAEVDTKGRARRLPIKAEIRRALCFPGDSTLLVAHLKRDTSILICPPKPLGLQCPQKTPSNSSPDVLASSMRSMEAKARRDNSRSNFLEANDTHDSIENHQPQVLAKDEYSMDVQKRNGSFPRDDKVADDKHCTDSGQGVKRRVWEASLSSLKSKKVKGGHHNDCRQGLDWDFSHDCDCSNDVDFVGCSMGTSKDKSLVEVIPRNHQSEKLPLRSERPRIMLMNIADDIKKTSLTTIVEELGGVVTTDGSICTHIITGKARRTLNFCIAMCSGAWIVSPNWLKSSFRAGRFVGELPFILQDEDYVLKYRSELKDAVLRAQEKPCALLKGYDVCLATRIQPSVDILSGIVKSAGGSVYHRLEEVHVPHKTIFVACEEDIEEALVAAKRGFLTYTSDWFMSCVMRQQLDLEAPQFAESLI